MLVACVPLIVGNKEELQSRLISTLSTVLIGLGLRENPAFMRIAAWQLQN
jgi:hypothetical protein